MATQINFLPITIFIKSFVPWFGPAFLTVKLTAFLSQVQTIWFPLLPLLFLSSCLLLLLLLLPWLLLKPSPPKNCCCWFVIEFLAAVDCGWRLLWATRALLLLLLLPTFLLFVLALFWALLFLRAGAGCCWLPGPAGRVLLAAGAKHKKEENRNKKS